MSRDRILPSAIRRIALGLLIFVAAIGAGPASAADILVLAAASLKNALDDADAAYQKESGTKIVASYAASGPLAKQIESGAPADLFISADLNWMNYVQERNLIKPDTRANLLGNRLVLIGPKDSNAKVEIAPGFPLASLVGNSRLAIGEPASVPAGQYAKEALTRLGVWDSVQGKLAPAPDVRSALTLVSRGEAPLGIVYETDVNADPGVKIVAAFPADSYPPIIYPIAELASSSNPDAPKFLAWLRSPAAVPFFVKQGFTIVK
jgi:molybdate transport system substrate-binding protein